MIEYIIGAGLLIATLFFVSMFIVNFFVWMTKGEDK